MTSLKSSNYVVRNYKLFSVRANDKILPVFFMKTCHINLTEK